ncbi:ATP-binding protein [Vibrio mexicanus]|uniref:ATP-binding protein n=1 Tax=Vibrio mexicanus TaxID=1004326 RepID=UPI00069C352B|nr:transporter substrate-binding domain-containing protein [Vibrio mexicanus]
MNRSHVFYHCNQTTRRLALQFWLVLVGACLSFYSAAQSGATEVQNWLNRGQTITFVVLDNHYPYSFINEQGQVDGVIKGYTQDLIERYGVSVDFHIVSSPSEAKKALREGIVDVFPFAQVPEKVGTVLISSKPYFPYQSGIAFTKDKLSNGVTSKSEGTKVGTVKGSLNLELAGIQLTRIKGIEFNSTLEALEALERQEIDGVLSEPISMITLANRIGIDDLSVIYGLEHWRSTKASMLVRKEAIELLALLNKQILSFPVEKHNELQKRWLSSSPYRPSLKGVFGFGNPPYMYPNSPAVGLEHHLIQAVFDEMGYQVGDVSTMPPSAAKKAMDKNGSISFVSSMPTISKSNFFASDPLVEIEYIPISLKRRAINLSSREPLKLGAMVYEDNSPSKTAVLSLKESISVESISNFDSMEEAFNQLRSQGIDAFVIEKRVLDWFIANTNFIEPDELQMHDKHALSYPIRVKFRDKLIRDKFNQVLSGKDFKKDRYQSIINQHVQIDLSRVLHLSKVVADVAAYFIVNDRLNELPELFDMFDPEGKLSVIELSLDNDPYAITSWYRGENRGLYESQVNLSNSGHVKHVASYVTSTGVGKAGNLDFYFSMDKLMDSYVYYPPVNRFARFGSGALNYIQEVYEDNELTDEVLNLDLREQKWVKDHTVIRLGVDPAALPYEAITSKGEYVGMIGDYVSLIKKKTGLNIEAHIVSSWSETEALIKSESLDLISAAVENKKIGDPYQPAKALFSARMGVAGRSGFYDLQIEEARGKKIGILSGASNTPFIMERYPNIEWVLIESTASGLEQVESKKLDGMVDTITVLNYLINSYGYTDISILERLNFYVSPTFHVTNREPELLAIINKAINLISTDEHRKIRAKWSAPREIETVDYQLVYTVSIFSLVILLLIFVWNRQLKKQVAIATKATQELEHAQQHLYGILNTSPIAAAQVINEQIDYINETARKLFRLEDVDVKSFDITTIYPDPQERADIHQELSTYGKVVNRELNLLKANGESFTALVSYYLFERDNKPVLLFWAFDISVMKELNHQLEEEKLRADQASQAKSEFLANMSHEIRTPMNAILGLSHLAIDEIANPIAKGYVKKVHHSAEALLSIINDILDFSKIEAGQLGLEYIPFNPRETIEEVTELIEVKSTDKGLTLDVDIAPEADQLMIGDPLRLFQIILNLVGNAIKFTQRGGVTISINFVEQRHDSVTLKYSIKDTGIGISPDNIDRLFKAFSQEDSTTTRRFGGTGLGLNISQKLVNAMGGTIDVESSLNEGSDFYFTLNFDLASQEQIEQHSKAQVDVVDSYLFNQARILLVEDNEFNQDLAFAC